MVSLRRHGVPIVASPYKSMDALLKHRRRVDVDDTDGGGFSVKDVRTVSGGLLYVFCAPFAEA